MLDDDPEGLDNPSSSYYDALLPSDDETTTATGWWSPSGSVDQDAAAVMSPWLTWLPLSLADAATRAVMTVSSATSSSLSSASASESASAEISSSASTTSSSSASSVASSTTTTTAVPIASAADVAAPLEREEELAVSVAATATSAAVGLWVYYFFHGIQDAMPSTALYLIWKETYHMEPAAFSFLSTLKWIPWILKPIFGYLSDRVPICGRRRIPYLTVGILLNAAGWWFLSGSTMLLPSRNAFLAVWLATSLAGVMAETAVDGLIAEMARLEASATSGNQIGWLQSTVWTFNAAGSVLGAIIPIALFWCGYGPYTILHGMALVAVLSTVSLLWIREKPKWHVIRLDEKSITSSTTSSSTVASNAAASTVPACDTTSATSTTTTTAAITKSFIPTTADLRECFQNPLLIQSLFFVFLVSSSPTSGTAFTYFQTDVLHFTPAFLSWTTVLQTVANFVAAAAYARWMRFWQVRTVFATAILGTMLTGLVNLLVVHRWNVGLGIPDRWFIVGDTVAQGVASEIVFMPVAVLAAQLAPVGREGTVYAVAMSVLNASWAVSDLVSGILSSLCFQISSPDHYEHLGTLILVVSLWTLVPLIFLRCLIPELSQTQEQERAPQQYLALGGGSNDYDVQDNDTPEHVEANVDIPVIVVL